MRRPSLPLLSALLLTSAAVVVATTSTSCAPASDDVGSTEEMSTAEDLALAKDIVTLLAGPSGRCKDCHTVTASKLRGWGAALKNVEAACFAPAGMTAEQRIDCLRTVPANPSSPFSPSKLGLYATATSHASFKELFEDAFPAETWSAEYVAFAQRVGMPRGRTALTPAEFARMKGWVLRGMPQLDEAFGVGDAGVDASREAGAGPDAAAPIGCTPSTTPALATHLAAMKATGWGARLADQATTMFGCGTATTPLGCLASLPNDTQTFGMPGVTQMLRRLHQQTLASHYWVRSSADGRYVGFGLDPSSKIVDLTKPTKPIVVAAPYDPFFVPSNDGFAFAGADRDGSIRLCRQSLLADVGGAANPSISLTEAKCSRVGNAVYQSIGSALDGTRYFMTWGSHENDDGGHDIEEPLPAAFGLAAKTTFTPMVNDGIAYRAQRPISVALPNEGDVMLSPSTLLAAARFGAGSSSKGYRIRFVKAQDAGGSLTIQTPLAAELCMPGQKAGFSFDERFVVTHQYVDLRDADQAAAGLAKGSSNVMLADLSTGKQVRITKSKAGVFALYPHFRADGWLYFLVRDMNTSTEYMVASDVAVRMSTP